ncbi:MAG: hypothetical protein HQ553_17140 [Chloroflexi bacterium]|nr:hypothetical protein [Chloroflexota bacterium]
MSKPDLREWKDDLEKLIREKGNSKDDLIEIIHSCEKIFESIIPANNFINEQRAFVFRIQDEYKKLYQIRFGEEAPELPQENRDESIVVLGTPDLRKQSVREIAISITQPGEVVFDKDILEALKNQGRQLDTRNPTATISTILNGFKSDFTKVDEGMGAFRRLTIAESEDNRIRGIGM